MSRREGETIEANMCDDCPVRKPCYKNSWPECNILKLRMRADEIEYYNFTGNEYKGCRV